MSSPTPPLAILAFGDSLTEGYSRVRRPLWFLCFGASLTEGYTQYGTRFTPYSKWMKEVLEKELIGEEKGDEKGKGGETGVESIVVDTDGMSGDLVTGGFRRRMERHFTDGPSRTEETPYDWVIFLGGTNDLAYRKKPTEIFTAIRDVVGIPLSYGARILLITIPECAAKSEALDSRRNALNEMMKEEARKNDCIFTFDLHAAIPYHSMPSAEHAEIWDDGLHFTPKGYERIGNMFAKALIDILRDGSKKNLG